MQTLYEYLVDQSKDLINVASDDISKIDLSKQYFFAKLVNVESRWSSDKVDKNVIGIPVINLKKFIKPFYHETLKSGGRVGKQMDEDWFDFKDYQRFNAQHSQQVNTGGGMYAIVQCISGSGEYDYGTVPTNIAKTDLENWKKNNNIAAFKILDKLTGNKALELLNVYGDI